MEQQQPNNKNIPQAKDIAGESEAPEVQPQEEEQEARPEGEFKEFCELSFGGFDMKMGFFFFKSRSINFNNYTSL